LDELTDPVELHGCDDGADVDALVERIAHAQRLHARAQPVDQRVRHAFLREYARARAAHLTLVEPDRVDHALDYAVKVGIVEDDEGRLAAQLERELLPGTRGRDADEAADFGGSRECDLVHAIVVDERLARATVARDDVHDAGGQANLLAQLRETQRRERRELGGLEYHRVPHGQCRRDLPREHEQREVPRDDLADDADGLVSGELGARELRPPRVVVEVPGDERDVDVTGLADGLAVVERLEHREHARVLLYAPRNGVQVAGARVVGERAPCRERSSRGTHRRVDVGSTALRDGGKRLCGRRVYRVEVLALDRVGPGAADVVTEAAAVRVE